MSILVEFAVSAISLRKESYRESYLPIHDISVALGAFNLHLKRAAV